MTQKLGRRLRILLVEDNPADVRLLQEAAREVELEADVTAVGDGERALEVLREGLRPDLVLLDLNLPRMDGREVLAEMKSDALLRSIPVVILSTSSSPYDVTECYNRHANSYLVKPLDLDDFTELVRKIGDYWLDLAQLPSAA